MSPSQRNTSFLKFVPTNGEAFYKIVNFDSDQSAQSVVLDALGKDESWDLASELVIRNNQGEQVDFEDRVISGRPLIVFLPADEDYTEAESNEKANPNKSNGKGDVLESTAIGDDFPVESFSREELSVVTAIESEIPGEFDDQKELLEVTAIEPESPNELDDQDDVMNMTAILAEDIDNVSGSESDTRKSVEGANDTIDTATEPNEDDPKSIAVSDQSEPKQAGVESENSSTGSLVCDSVWAKNLLKFVLFLFVFVGLFLVLDGIITSVYDQDILSLASECPFLKTVRKTFNSWVAV